MTQFLADYIDNHPGGAVAIQPVAGRDGTKAFLEHHSLELLLDDPEFIACRIGRLVDERDEGDIDEDEIAIHGSIFNVSGTWKTNHLIFKKSQENLLKIDTGLYTEDRALHRLLMEWYGSDATEILTEDKPEYASLRNSLTRFFLDRKDCVVAKIRSSSSEKALREVTARDVAKHGEDNKHAIWVSVDDDVFDVTGKFLSPARHSRTIHTDMMSAQPSCTTRATSAAAAGWPPATPAGPCPPRRRPLGCARTTATASSPGSLSTGTTPCRPSTWTTSMIGSDRQRGERSRRTACGTRGLFVRLRKPAGLAV